MSRAAVAASCGETTRDRGTLTPKAARAAFAGVLGERYALHRGLPVRATSGIVAHGGVVRARGAGDVARVRRGRDIARCRLHGHSLRRYSQFNSRPAGPRLSNLTGQVQRLQRFALSLQRHDACGQAQLARRWRHRLGQ